MLLGYAEQHTRKPQGVLEIDWSNPLSKGLAFSAYPDLNSYDLVNDSFGINSGAVNTFSKEGKHLLLNSLGDYQRYENHLAKYITDEITIIFDGAIDSMEAFGCIVAVPYDNDGVWDNPFFTLTFHRSSSGDSGRFGYAVGGSFKNAVSDAGFLKIDDSKHQYSITRKGDQVKFHLDAVQHGSIITVSGGTGNIDFNDTAPIHLGTRNHLTNDENMAGTFKGVHIFNRALDERELFSLKKNPYQLLKPRENYLFIPEVAVGVTIPVLQQNMRGGFNQMRGGFTNG